MIVARFRRGRDLLDAWFDQGQLGGFFVPTHQSLPVGAEEPLEVRFSDGKIFRSRCRVVWRRVQGRPGLPAGLGLELLPTEQRVRDLLLGHARGRDIPYADRGSRRVPARLRASFRTGAGRIDDSSEDISEDGLFIRTRERLPVGTRGTLTLKAPGRVLGVRVPAVVARQVEGLSGGLGLRFEIESDRQLDRIRDLIRRVLSRAEPRTTLVTRVQGR